MAYDKDDLHVRNLAIGYAIQLIDVFGNEAGAEDLVEAAAIIEGYLLHGIGDPS